MKLSQRRICERENFLFFWISAPFNNLQNVGTHADKMLAKLLSENDLQITNFVTNLQNELALKEETNKKFKSQMSAIENDFLCNLSFIKDR